MPLLNDYNIILKNQDILFIYIVTDFLAFQEMMKECMVRLIYCEMLGYDASFGYIHAIKLAQQGNLLEKRVGMYVLKKLSYCNVVLTIIESKR